jgi:AraC-like DNA-binding protein
VQLCFATRAASRSERARQWCAATQAANVELEDDREASIRGGDMGGVRICTVAIGRHRMFSEQGGRAAEPRSARSGAIKLIFQEEGECLFEQDGKAVMLRPGQWCAYEKARPWRISAAGFCRQTALVLPQGAFGGSLGRRADLRRGLMVGRSFLTGAGSVLHASVGAAVTTLDTLSKDDRSRLGAVLSELLELALSAEEDERDRGSRQSRRQAVADYVERHLADPDLGLASIARALGCSKRTLHKLFAGEAVTVGRLILERRLERCRAELVDPAMAGRTITEIAHAWGFNDLQHFSRAFKARFGAAPRELRVGARAVAEALEPR